MNMRQKEFNVLIMDFNNKKIEPYNVLPYFRNGWKKKNTNKLIQNKRS